MTATGPPAFRLISFGDLDGQVWGCALQAGGPLVLVASPEGTVSATGAAAVTVIAEGGGWRVVGPGFALDVVPAPPDGDGRAPAGGNELCAVSGSLSIASAERSLEAIGTATLGEPLDITRLDSLRAVSGWFEPDDGLTLVALRPSGRKDQESDIVAATLLERDGWTAVDDPRLSTTYRFGGQPAKASLELWIGEGDEQFPRRAAAEASGEPATVESDRVHLAVTPLRCHKGGRDGAGVYLLARFNR
jgi:hypothetical protein